MKSIIAHRGNLQGPDPSLENHPEHINEALQTRIDTGWHIGAEVDMWFVDKEFYLGHDEPQYPCPKWLISPRQTADIWFHAKNYEALLRLLELKKHVFWHQEDNFTLTSKGYIWTYPGVREVGGKSIVVMPERDPYFNVPLHLISGVCTDFALDWAEKLKEGPQ